MPVSVVVVVLSWLLISIIFRHLYLFSDFIKNIVFLVFFFLFLFLQPILIQKNFIEYYISALNDFVIFIII